MSIIPMVSSHGLSIAASSSYTGATGTWPSSSACQCAIGALNRNGRRAPRSAQRGWRGGRRWWQSAGRRRDPAAQCVRTRWSRISGSWHITNIQPSAALIIWLGVALGCALRGVRCRDIAFVQIPERGVAGLVHRARQQVQVHVAALATALSIEQSGEQRDRHLRSGHEIDHRQAKTLRIAIGVPGQRAESRLRPASDNHSRATWRAHCRGHRR